MARYQFAKPARAALLDQLIAAGFPPTTPVEMLGDLCWVTVDPADFARAAAVVAAHDAAALDAATSQAEADDLADRSGAWAAAQNLAAERDLLMANPPTAADVRRILLLLVRVLLALLRYLHRRGL
jgi:hypothetical protein